MAEEKKTTRKEAAEKFVYDWAGLSPTERRIAERAYLAGAEWQKEQMLKGDRLTELDKSYKQAKRELEWFKEGQRQGREQMLKDAVEGFIYQSADYYPKQLIAGYDGELGMGDKVKIVIIPEKEDKK